MNKVSHFSAERIRAELDYIGERVPDNTRTLFISDLNFGMYARDAGICNDIALVKERYGYP